MLQRVSNLPTSCTPAFSIVFVVVVAFGLAVVDTFAVSANVFLFDIPAGGLQGGGFQDAGLKHE